MLELQTGRTPCESAVSVAISSICEERSSCYTVKRAKRPEAVLLAIVSFCVLCSSCCVMKGAKCL